MVSSSKHLKNLLHSLSNILILSFLPKKFLKAPLFILLGLKKATLHFLEILRRLTLIINQVRQPSKRGKRVLVRNRADDRRGRREPREAMEVNGETLNIRGLSVGAKVKGADNDVEGAAVLERRGGDTFSLDADPLLLVDLAEREGHVLGDAGNKVVHHDGGRAKEVVVAETVPVKDLEADGVLERVADLHHNHLVPGGVESVLLDLGLDVAFAGAHDNIGVALAVDIGGGELVGTDNLDFYVGHCVLR